MNNLDWLHNKAVSTSEIARRIEMSTSLFAKKLHGRPVNAGKEKTWAFTPDELKKLDTVRLELISELENRQSAANFL